MTYISHTNSAAPVPKTLNQLLLASADSDAAFSEFPLEAGELAFSPAGVLYESKLLPMAQPARTQSFTRVGAPGRYFEKHSPEFQAAAPTEHARRGDFGTKPTLVMRAGEVITIVRGELLSLPNADVIRAVEEALGPESDALSVTRIGGHPERLDVEMVSASKAITVRPGDIVQSGIHIAHERFGTQATLVEVFIYRLVCSNGMTRRECVGNGIARTRKLPVEFPNNRELQMSQIRRLTTQSWNSLQAQLEALRGTSDRIANVEQLLIRWLQRARISTETMMPRLLAAWRDDGAENTHYGAVNAITRVATHDQDLSERQRRVLAALAGLLAFSDVHICQRCFSLLPRGSATSGNTDESPDRSSETI